MTFILSMLCVSLYVALCKKSIKSHARFHYIGAAILAVIIVLNPFSGFPQFFKSYIQPILTNGGIATAMFVLVMYAGALKNGTKLKKTLMSLRAELSIIASTLTLAHNITYSKVYLKHLFINPQFIPLNFRIATYTSMLMFVIMVPLWITSYPSIRKKMKAKTWKKLQRWAYLFYALIYLHVVVIMVPLIKMGDKKYLISVIIYSIVFGTYGFMRLSRAKIATSYKSLAYGCLALVLLTVGGFSYANTVNANNVAPIVEGTESQTETTVESSQTDLTEATSAQTTEAVSLDDTLTTSETDSSATENTSETAESTSEEATESSEATTLTETTAAINESTSTLSTSESEVTTSTADETTAEAPTTVATTEATTTEVVTTTTEAPTTTEVVTTTTAAPTTTEAPTTTAAPKTKYRDGTYTASGTGYKGSGSITVSIVIQNDKITSATVTNYSDDALYVNMCSALLSNIVSNQTAEVNTVSGATYSSNGIKEAARNAINQALN